MWKTKTESLSLWILLYLKPGLNLDYLVIHSDSLQVFFLKFKPVCKEFLTTCNINGPNKYNMFRKFLEWYAQNMKLNNTVASMENHWESKLGKKDLLSIVYINELFLFFVCFLLFQLEKNGC